MKMSISTASQIIFIMAKITAPFSDAQVEALNEFQKSGVMHPFTCGKNKSKKCKLSDIHEGFLVATKNGWVCPDCGYRQDWAHDFMADINIINQMKNLISEVEIKTNNK